MIVLLPTRLTAPTHYIATRSHGDDLHTPDWSFIVSVGWTNGGNVARYSFSRKLSKPSMDSSTFLPWHCAMGDCGQASKLKFVGIFAIGRVSGAG